MDTLRKIKRLTLSRIELAMIEAGNIEPDEVDEQTCLDRVHMALSQYDDMLRAYELLRSEKVLGEKVDHAPEDLPNRAAWKVCDNIKQVNAEMLNFLASAIEAETLERANINLDLINSEDC